MMHQKFQQRMATEAFGASEQTSEANGRDAIYTACTIGNGLTELKKLYSGNKKLLICATKDLVSIMYVIKT